MGATGAGTPTPAQLRADRRSAEVCRRMLEIRTLFMEFQRLGGLIYCDAHGNLRIERGTVDRRYLEDQVLEERLRRDRVLREEIEDGQLEEGYE